MTMYQEVSRFSISNREAVIVEDHEGYMIRLYEDGQLKHEMDVRAHTLQYAEDCAENWVFKYGQFRSNDN